jgi:serine/threonine-protein kinase
MDGARWRQITAIFERAVELAPAGRAALLEHACAGDAQLRREVEALLEADATGDTFDRHAHDLRGAAAADWVDWNASFDGRLIGPWRVVRELGRGGMGVVFLVERADGQFEQLAALKLIKRGMDSEAVLSRFLRERQILARLEHRNIARLLDGGLIPDGRPYFVMEYVDGMPLPQYCAAHGSDLVERLRLFFGVCAAVQFAHRQLVVHSDLKPSNVLVGANGDVKLLDFGIAKLLGGDGAAAPQTRDRPLTPAYAAPEQIRGEPLSTATDVYALGCLLYELLTGQRPFRLHDEPSLEQLRQVLDSTGPVAPSQLRTADAPVPPQRLRGDLDTIVLKALKREPDRRYATVDALAEDLKRFLAGLPIAAHRDSSLYRARKFVARHWLATAMSALAVAALSTAIAVAAWQAREKASEAQAAQEVAHFLVGLFEDSDPTHSRGAAATAQDLLDQGAARLHSALSEQPLLRARLLHTVATSYAALGLYDRAQPLAEQALDIRRRELAARDPAIAESLYALGRIYARKADYARAEPLLREALERRRENADRDGAALLESLGGVGKLLQDRGAFQQASAPLREALETAERRFGPESVETANSLDDFAGNLKTLGKMQDAVSLYRRALAIREARLGANDPDVGASLHNLGLNLAALGNYAEAETALQRALAIRRQVFGPVHPLVGESQLALAAVYEATYRVADAEPLAQAALAIFRSKLGESHRLVTEAMNTLAVLHLDRRDYAQAVSLFREVFDRFRDGLGAEHPDTLTVEDNLAISLFYAGRADEAEALQRDLVGKLRPDNGQGVDVKNLHNLARTLEQEGRVPEALELVRRALDVQRGLTGERSRGTALALREVALAEHRLGDAKSAETHYRAALALAEELAPAGGFAVHGWQIPLADFLVGQRRCAEATPLLRKAADALDASANVNPIWRPQADILLAACARHAPPQPADAQRLSAARQALRTLPAIELDLYPTARRLLDES